MRVRVVTDSAASLPDAVARPLGITVVPLRITVGERSVRDGELDAADLVAHAAEVSTAGPTPGDYLDAIERGERMDVVVLTVSRKMAAGSHLAAEAAARTTDRNLRIVDTETAAGGQALVALAAGSAAAEGSLDEVAATAATVAGTVRLVATLPDLDQLAASGHVPGAAAWAVRFAGLHPILDFRRGRVRPLRPTLSADAAGEQMLGLVHASRPDAAAALHVSALHSLVPDRAGNLLAAIEARYRPATSFVAPFSTAMTVHTGRGVLGLAWWWERIGSG